MKLISWNVNGIRACLQKGFEDAFRTLNADFFCLQETKLQPEQISIDFPGYSQFWNSAEKKGYSGTAVFTTHAPLSVTYGVGVDDLDHEGRMITLEYEKFYLVTCYTPNVQDALKRIDHRLSWDDAFREKLQELDARKPVIACGDLNVAHQEIDLKNPKTNTGNAGFTPQERGAMTKLLDSGFVDSFRYLKNPGPNRGNPGFSDEERESFTKLLAAGFTDTFRFRNPELAGAYSWWSYRFHAREKNAGWRIDYFLVSDRLQNAIEAAPIYSEIYGSDHCPVGLELKEELL